MKRFYKTASAAHSEYGFAVLLDGKGIKTPARNYLAVPTEALAQDIAREWNAQGETIDQSSLMLTRFANSAIDAVALKMDEVRDEIVAYAQSDLLLYRADEPLELAARQARSYDPILNWLSSCGLAFTPTHGIMPVAQPEQSLKLFREKLGAYDAFALSALSSMTALTSSAGLAYAVATGFLSPEAAWSAAHIDEDFQIEKWGRDDEATQRRAARWKEMEAAARLLALLKSTCSL